MLTTPAGTLASVRSPERERHPIAAQPLGLWAPSGPTAALLRALSQRLDLGWRLNRAARPELLALTNLGRSDPARLAARCRPRQVSLCLDDRAGRDFLSCTSLPCFTYSEGRHEADLTAHDLRVREGRLTFLAVTKQEMARVTVPDGALYYSLSALASAVVLGVPLPAAARALGEIYWSQPSPGEGK